MERLLREQFIEEENILIHWSSCTSQLASSSRILCPQRRRLHQCLQKEGEGGALEKDVDESQVSSARWWLECKAWGDEEVGAIDHIQSATAYGQSIQWPSPVPSCCERWCCLIQASWCSYCGKSKTLWAGMVEVFIFILFKQHELSILPPCML